MHSHTSFRSHRLSRSFSRVLVLLLLFALLYSGLQRGRATATLAQEEASPETLGFVENFDGVTAPALPASWTSTASNALVPFVTSSSTPDTPPNALFVPDPAGVGLSEVVTPTIQVGNNSHLIFRHNYATESTFDGGVVEIKIGTGEFQDIFLTGGGFISGAYNSTLSANFMNPLSGRQAWSGNSNGYITTDINLPAAAAGRMLQFRWRMGTDSSVGATGWRIDGVLVTNTITGQNTNGISLPDSGPASLYPSNVTVSNQLGSVTGVVVALDSFTHTAPDDVDLMLVAPGGRKVILMSDVGGTNPVTNLSLTFDDTAANSLPDSGVITTGSYKPTNFEPGDIFPAPAPPGAPTGTTLSAFNGINANGVWSLYAVDDNGNNAGSISGGWGLLVTTSADACSLNLTPSIQVFPITGGSGSFDLSSPFGCDWTASSPSSFIHITSSTSGSGGNNTITFTVDPNMGAGRNGIINVSTTTLTRIFTVQQPSGCPFSLSQETQNFGSAGGSGNVSVTAAGACGWEALTKDTWITITSGTGTGNGNVMFTVAANNTGAQRTGTVTIGARTLTVVQSGGGKTLFDFDGDAKADLSVFRPSTASWYILQSNNGSLRSQAWGLASDSLAPADYDGDGKADIAVYRSGSPSAFYILQSSDNTLRSQAWGQTGDLPVSADFDGDGKADVAVWRPTNGYWYVLQSTNGNVRAQGFGTSGDVPTALDFDADDRADLAVFRPSSGTWYIFQSTDNSVRAQAFGANGDRAVAADYDGDGRADLAVYRAGTWYLQRSTSGFISYQFGNNTDVAVAADYDGDHKADIGVFRQGAWYILQSSNGATRSEQWGASGDAAVPAAYNF